MLQFGVLKINEKSENSRNSGHASHQENTGDAYVRANVLRLFIGCEISHSIRERANLLRKPIQVEDRFITLLWKSLN